MNRLSWVIIGGLALLLAAGGAARAQTPEDAIIARVNGEAVTLSQLKEAALDQDVPPSALLLAGPQNEGYRKALTQLVDETLLTQEAATEGVKPNDMTITRDVERMISELRTQLGSQEKLDDFLKSHHLTLAGLRAVMGERERRRALTAEVVAKRVAVDESVVAKFVQEHTAKKLPLQQVNLAQILVPCTPAERAGADGAALKREALQAAREASAVKADAMPGYLMRLNASAKGRARAVALGWLDPASMIPALAEAARKMQPGDVSQPLESDQGYHVLVMMGRHSERDLAFAEEFARTRVRLINQLRRDASVQIYDLAGRQIKLDLTETTTTAKVEP